MKLVFHTRQEKDRLLLFFLGWGMDENPFRGLSLPDHDVALIYDYRDLTLPEIPPYPEVILMGWSVGVYAGILALEAGMAEEAVFLAGTGAFSHRGFGIHPRLWGATLRALKRDPEGTLLKFYRNMFADEEDFRRFLARCPQRALPEIVEELEALLDYAPRFEVPGRVRAFVPQEDAIFPPPAQERFWKACGVSVRAVPAGHFPFYRFPFEEFFSK